MTLDDENVGMGLKLGPGTFGMNVPSTCTIVIIAGTLDLQSIRSSPAQVMGLGWLCRINLVCARPKYVNPPSV